MFLLMRMKYLDKMGMLGMELLNSRFDMVDFAL